MGCTSSRLIRQYENHLAKANLPAGDNDAPTQRKPRRYKNDPTLPEMWGCSPDVIEKLWFKWRSDTKLAPHEGTTEGPSESTSEGYKCPISQAQDIGVQEFDFVATSQFIDASDKSQHMKGKTNAIPNEALLCDETVDFVIATPSAFDAILHILGRFELPKMLKFDIKKTGPGNLSNVTFELVVRVCEKSIVTVINHEFALLDLFIAADNDADIDSKLIERFAVLLMSAAASSEDEKKRIKTEITSYVLGNAVRNVEDQISAIDDLRSYVGAEELEGVFTSTKEINEDFNSLVKEVQSELAALAASERIPTDKKNEGPSSSSARPKFEPYNYGKSLINQAYGARMRRLSRATMCAWECTMDHDWPVSMPRKTKAAQIKTLQQCHVRNKQVKQLRKQGDTEEVKMKIRKINRKTAGAVNNVKNTTFATLSDRLLFDQTRRFSKQAHDLNVEKMAIYQAGRNAWTCFALQVIYDSKDADCHDGVFGYSMLYPFTDNYLDDPKVDLFEKLDFQDRFERKLLGVNFPEDMPSFDDGVSAFKMVDLIEGKWNRPTHPITFLSLAAINDAQTWSLFQHSNNIAKAAGVPEDSLHHPPYTELLHQSVYKGGTSVMADAYMVNGVIPVCQEAFSFALGFGLQLVDDLQDSVDDMNEGQNTLFTLAEEIHNTKCGDDAARRLANFLYFVVRGSRLTSPTCDSSLETLLLAMVWNMVLKAIARNPTLHSDNFEESWGPLGPLPPKQMAYLQSMNQLHRLALAEEI